MLVGVLVRRILASLQVPNAWSNMVGTEHERFLPAYSSARCRTGFGSRQSSYWTVHCTVCVVVLATLAFDVNRFRIVNGPIFAVSSSSPHAKQSGLSERPILCRCFLNLPCTVINDTKFRRVSLLSLNRYFFTLNFGPTSYSFDCRQLVTDFQWFIFALSAHVFVVIWAVDPDNGRTGSGPKRIAAEPSLVSLSAISLPAMSQWPGTHDRYTLFKVESAWREVQHCITIDVNPMQTLICSEIAPQQNSIFFDWDHCYFDKLIRFDYWLRAFRWF
jgi:hypothetical protein